MRIFLTGGTGLIGKSIIEGLILNRVDITALYRSRRFETANVKWIQGDLTDPKIDLAGAVEGHDCIIHNAASLLTGKTAEETSLIEEVNVRATQRLLECARIHHAKFIFTSSFSVIKKPLPEVITEESETAPLLPYSVSKLKGENMVIDYSNRFGLKYNILRISSPIGLTLGEMPSTVVKTWIEKSKAGETLSVFGDGGRKQDFVSVIDIANAFLQSVKKLDLNGIFNIASGSPLSMRELAILITGRFGNLYSLAGNDIDGTDRWNISLKKSNDIFGYYPKFTSEGAINKLLKTIPV